MMGEGNEMSIQKEVKLDVKGVMTHLWIDTSGLERRSVAARNKKFIEQYLTGRWLRTGRDLRDQSQRGSGSRGY